MQSIKSLTIKIFTLLATFLIAVPVSSPDPLEYREDRPLGDVVSIDQAVSEFEQELKIDILLPSYIPFEVTYSGAKYNPADKTILIAYLNQKTGALMDVHVKLGKMPQQLTSRQKLIKMNVGNNIGIYESDEKRVVNFIYFYNNGLEYRIGLSKRPVEYKQDTYIKIVESFK